MIIFIMKPYAYKDIYNLLGEPNHNLEQVQEYKNKIFWSYDLKIIERLTGGVRLLILI